MNEALRGWAYGVGRRIAESYIRSQVDDMTSFFSDEIARGGPLLALLREDAANGFRERLEELRQAKEAA